MRLPASRSPHHTARLGAFSSLHYHLRRFARPRGRAVVPLACAHVCTSVCVWLFFRFLNKTHDGDLTRGTLEGGGNRRPGEFSDIITYRLRRLYRDLDQSNPKEEKTEQVKSCGRANRAVATHSCQRHRQLTCIPIFLHVP